MSTIAPNGQVKLLANVPIDETYENTLYFESESAQRTYFLGLTPIHTMTNATRVRDGVIAVNALEDDIRHANYLMFQNMAFGNKWFYGFVKFTEYVNNGTTYVYYEIDEVQSWLISKEVKLGNCLIERQHSVTDNIGDNIVGENIGASELVVGKTLATKDLTHHEHSEQFQSGDKLVVLNVAKYLDTDQHPPVWVTVPTVLTDGVANSSQCYGWIYNDTDTDLSSISDMISSLTLAQQSESIIGGYVLPAEMFIPFNISKRITDESVVVGSGAQEPSPYSLDTSGAYSALGSYTNVKNKKMFTAPFNWIYVLSTDGQMMALQPQYLNNKNKVDLINYHCIVGVPEARIVLQNYKGQTEASEYFLNYSDFPQFSYAIDGYKAWLASGGEKSLELSLSQVTRSEELKQSQTKFNAGLSMVKDVGQVGKGLIQSTSDVRKVYTKGIGNVVEGTYNLVSDIGNTMYTLEASQQTIQFANENADLSRSIAKTLPASVHGSASNTSLLGATNIKIKAEQRCVNANIAKTIDDYFTMYGYAQNIVATPNIHARPKFTYVKTIGCQASGGAPSDTIAKIKAIFNSGIRFWVNASEVGDYTVNNAPQ